MKALVTGASSGIGRDISIYLSNLGYELILVARHERELMETQKLLKTKSEIYSADLANVKEVYKLYEKYQNTDIDILVNGAGFGLFGLTSETDLDRELEMIDLNIKAVHILTKLFLQNFMKKDSGYIMNIASAAGFLAGPRLNAYYATKNYVLKFTMALSEELRHQGSNVHVCALCPGPVATNFNKVAGGKFAVKEADSEYVAKYGVDKMFKNKLIIVPTLSVKAGIFFSRFLPHKILLKIVYKIQEKKSRPKY